MYFYVKKLKSNIMIKIYLVMQNMHLYIQKNIGSNNVTIMFHKLFIPDQV